MIELSDNNFPKILDTSSGDLIKDFFEPALTSSIRYDRGVGFFSAAWLRLSAKGMTTFAQNSGRARWVTSPILSEDDWAALQKGEAARYDEILRKAVEININDLEHMLEKETLSALAWLVADGILDFKLALPRNKLEHGEFHDKFGIFTDFKGNQVSFNGSYNDSIKGTHNYESIKIFCSWEKGFSDLVNADFERFNCLWNNLDSNVQVFDLPEAAREHIIKLRTKERPYPEPDWTKLESFKEEETKYTSSPLQPQIPANISLRDYQIKAIDEWFNNDCIGLLEMATGTGKTITALAASVRLYDREKGLAVIIAAPFQHLVDQWDKEARLFGYLPILAYQSKKQWINKLSDEILQFNGNYRQFFCVITTHTTFCSTEFQSIIAKLKSPSLLIADEVHHLGSEVGRVSYPQNITYRLALSATPDRWYDEEGTSMLHDYFGETVFSFPLEKAIGISLTPYYYYPHLVTLTDDEMEQYEELSAKIAPLINREDESGQRTLKMLLIQRANLLNVAQNKIGILSEIIDAQEEIKSSLFYCAPGQIDEALRLIGLEKGILVHKFTAEEDPEKRQQLLADFANGELQGLVAMKCLDEGVDVPNTRTAYILASSGNPREFIQRRGRILRKASNKEYSIIHDLITIPPAIWTMPNDSAMFEAERSIIRRELRRFKEFADLALNKHEAYDVIWEIARKYNLMDF